MKKLFLLAAVLSMAMNAMAYTPYSDLWTMARDPNFQGRVKMAFQSVALDVMNEPNTIDSHGVRFVFAQKIISGQVNYLYEFAAGILVYQDIAQTAVNADPPNYSITDAQIRNAADYFFNAFAGVSK